FLLPKKSNDDLIGSFKRGRDVYAFDLKEERVTVLFAMTPKQTKNATMRKYTALALQHGRMLKSCVPSGYAPPLICYYFASSGRFRLPLDGALFSKQMGIYERYSGSLDVMWDRVISRNPLTDLVHVMLPLASTLEKFHAENIVLRDIKLANVLVKDHVLG